MQIRDRKLLEGIEKHRYLRSDQAAELYFPTIKHPKQKQNKARERLLLLYKNKLVNRARYPNEPYIYFTQGTSRSHKMEHYLTITDVLLKLQKQFPAGSHIKYEIEVKKEDVVTDLLIHYKNEFRREKYIFYIEVELNSSANIENKIKAYEDIIEDPEKEILLIACRNKNIIEKIKGIKTHLKVIATDLDVKLGSLSFK